LISKARFQKLSKIIMKPENISRGMMGGRRVVVTGLGSISPLGLNMEATWNEAKAGNSGIGRITRFEADAFSCRFAGEVKNFDPSLFFDAKEVKKVDLFTQFAVAAADEAMKDAGCNTHEGASKLPYDPRSIGCMLGVGIGGLAVLERNHEQYLKGGPKKISPFLIPGMITNMAPGIIGIKQGINGVNYTIQSACTSASHAIGEAFRMVSSGIQEMVLAGGAEAAITPVGIGGFCSMKALSTRNDDPTKASRPFDKDRDGFVMGEGSVILVIESFDGARARGAKIYGEIIGYGFSCDAFHMTAPCVDGAGAVQSMQSALACAGITPTAVDYVNAHGTSTPANDAAETAAIKTVFGDYAKAGLAVSSTKSVTGHLLGAAGAIEAAFCLKAIKEGVIPPTATLENPSADCDLDYVPKKARVKDINIAISNSFGFGGTNATIVFGKV
jgi:3-oxoacyl-[acyl-carrier-protein] synthase II